VSVFDVAEFVSLDVPEPIEDEPELFIDEPLEPVPLEPVPLAPMVLELPFAPIVLLDLSFWFMLLPPAAPPAVLPVPLLLAPVLLEALLPEPDVPDEPVPEVWAMA
jgi:hypothetical protein